MNNKREAYEQAQQEINAVLHGESNMILKMATINCILKQHLPYYYWVGFYCVNNGSLLVGPYQGTMGCLHIPYTKGVCGRTARLQETQLVDDVHADPEHMACDARSQSEIVVPVFDNENNLIAVFDVDSTEIGSFDEIDKEFLEAIINQHFREEKLVKEYV